jgi:hypothetical protein
MKSVVIPTEGSTENGLVWREGNATLPAGPHADPSASLSEPSRWGRHG